MKSKIIINENTLKNVEKYEIISKHEVIAHIEQFKSELSKESGKFVHFGCTSCFVQDNSDIYMQIRCLKLLKNKSYYFLNLLKILSLKYKNVPCVGYTHIQPAQFVTIGKRFCIYASRLLDCINYLNYVINNIKYLGLKGATGTQDSYLKILNSSDKVFELEKMFENKYGTVEKISSQTYNRQQDEHILFCCANFARLLSNICLNLRISSHDEELYEPFDTENQVGSSSMPYKKNPIKSERICSLSKIIISNINIELASDQIYERVLTDSACRRLKLDESLCLTDYILTLICHIFENIFIDINNINIHCQKFLSIMISEEIIIKMVKLGFDRQDVHLKLKNIMLNNSNNIIEIIKADNFFNKLNFNSLNINKSSFIGLCPEQISNFWISIEFPTITTVDTYFKY